MVKSRQYNGWLILFKFGQREHLETFQKEGLLHMKSLSYFSDLERFENDLSHIVRADRYEGSNFIYSDRKTNLTMTFPTLSKSLTTIEVPPEDIVDISFSLDAMRCNVFCMYGMTTPEPINEKNFNFGDSVIIISNAEEFINHVSKAVKIQNLQGIFKLVQYHNLNNHSGITGPFVKHIDFAYQNEYRIVVEPCIDPHIELKIGSLEYITSKILPLSEVNKYFDSSADAARKAGLTW